LYENLYLKYNTSIDESEGVFSTVHQIHDYKTPAHRYFDIGIKPSGIPENMREKAFIAYCCKSSLLPIVVNLDHLRIVEESGKMENLLLKLETLVTIAL